MLLPATNVLPGNYGIDNMHTFRNTSIHQSTNEYGKKVLELCIGFLMAELLEIPLVGQLFMAIMARLLTITAFAVRTSCMRLISFKFLTLMLLFLIIALYLLKFNHCIFTRHLNVLEKHPVIVNGMIVGKQSLKQILVMLTNRYF